MKKDVKSQADIARVAAISSADEEVADGSRRDGEGFQRRRYYH